MRFASWRAPSQHSPKKAGGSGLAACPEHNPPNDPRLGMAIAPRNPRQSSIDIWPGFVDALSQLLMVIIFILLVFTAGQFYLSAALSGREEALTKLQRQVDALASML